MPSRHSLGQLLNEAVRIKPAASATEPKAGHVTFADMFWEALFEGDPQHDIVSELNRIMNYLLTQSKRDPRTERAVWFVSFCFGRLLNSEHEAKRQSANAFVNTLCDRSRCENKTVRFRSCQCIRQALEPLPDHPEIDASIVESIYATLLARIRDRSYEVRTQALLALDRFKTAGSDGEFRNDQVTAAYLNVLQSDPHPNPRAAALNCLPLTSITADAICERTKDVSDVVRLHALKVISAKVLPELMGSRRFGDVLRNGLTDRLETVQRAAVETLLRSFDNVFNKNLHQLFNFIAWETHSDIFSTVMETLLKRRLDQIVEWAGRNRLEWKRDMQNVTAHEALFWKTLFCCAKKLADRVGKEATTEPEKERESQTLFDLIDQLLPPSLTEFLQFFQFLFQQGCILQCCEFLQILTLCFNFTEEADQNEAAELYLTLCHYIPEEPCDEWHTAVIALGRSIWSDTSEFVQKTLTLLERMFNEVGDRRDEEWQRLFHHWLSLSVEMLRALPFRVRNFLALGSPGFTTTDVFDIYKSSAMDPNLPPMLEKLCVEGMGICLAFKTTHEHSEVCLPVIWKAMDSGHTETAVAAIDALCTISMIYGVRYVDQRPTITTAIDPVNTPLWDCTIFRVPNQQKSLPLHLTNLLHWDDETCTSIKTAAAKSLCKLLTLNNRMGQFGMHAGECIQCLCPLVSLLVYGEVDEAWTECTQQMLTVFFDRYAQSHTLHQYLFRAGFIPILRYCLDSIQAYRLSIQSAAKFLANLLVAPLHCKSIEEEPEKNQRAVQNTQLMMLLLMEIAHCPDGLYATKVYVSALWKVILDLDITSGDDGGKLLVSAMMDTQTIRTALNAKQYNQLKKKLNLSSDRSVPEEKLREVTEKVKGYIQQLGSHPFSGEDDSDE